MSFTTRDLEQISARGADAGLLEQQLQHFRNGFPFAKLIRPATISDGILQVPEAEAKQLSLAYEDLQKGKKIIKFVPASGAATRMFKHLFEFLDWYDGSGAAIEKLNADKGFNSVWYFLDNLREFAFYEDLKAAVTSDGKDLRYFAENMDYAPLVHLLLYPEGLNYGNLPKALLKFHPYPGGSRTALEEHLAEGAAYCRDPEGKVKLHFTLSPEHIDRFDELLGALVASYEKQYLCSFEISHSVQKPSTDTIAANPDNTPFREKDGSLVFRPGGHGALIENLNDLDADIVFIKNIDNVVPDRLKGPTFLYKRVIRSLLLDLQQRTFGYLMQMEDGDTPPGLIDEVAAFATNELFIKLPGNFSSMPEDTKREFIVRHLNRPMRICGMVKNEGEPGGGPFWMQDSSGDVSLQIVESSQVNMNDNQQKTILQHSTHFNPVDLVCSLKDHHGIKFNLHHFIDEETGFISIKSKDGRPLKALELPGLWNGAMAKWITIFVEVPVSTFNPVKTVNDLLRKEHR